MVTNNQDAHLPLFVNFASIDFNIYLFRGLYKTLELNWTFWCWMGSFDFKCFTRPNLFATVNIPTGVHICLCLVLGMLNWIVCAKIRTHCNSGTNWGNLHKIKTYHAQAGNHRSVVIFMKLFCHLLHCIDLLIIALASHCERLIFMFAQYTSKLREAIM